MTEINTAKVKTGVYDRLIDGTRLVRQVVLYRGMISRVWTLRFFGWKFSIAASRPATLAEETDHRWRDATFTPAQPVAGLGERGL